MGAHPSGSPDLDPLCARSRVSRACTRDSKRTRGNGNQRSPSDKAGSAVRSEPVKRCLNLRAGSYKILAPRRGADDAGSARPAWRTPQTSASEQLERIAARFGVIDEPRLEPIRCRPPPPRSDTHPRPWRLCDLHREPSPQFETSGPGVPRMNVSSIAAAGFGAARICSSPTSVSTKAVRHR
jgi:hypothetical protein